MMKFLLFISSLLLMFVHKVNGQQVSALNIHLTRQVSSAQPNLPDSTFDLIGIFEMSDSLDVLELHISLRENFQDTLSSASYLVLDTLNINTNHPVLYRVGNNVSFNYPSLLSAGNYFFQVDFIDYNGVRIGRTIKQF